MMSQAVGQTELQEKTRQLMDGPLKHIKAAALAAALLPLASVAAAPASAQSICQSAGSVCGFVWNDTDKDGVQDFGETGLEGAKVSIIVGADTLQTETGPDGFYYFAVDPGNYPIAVQVPQNMTPSPANVGSDDAFDSDGVSDGNGFSGTTVTLVGSNNTNTDFGFYASPNPNPGTGTPGYWKNHPDAWPVGGITIGTNTYTKAQAISWLGKVGKDKTTTIFASYVSAFLNVQIGNDNSCVGNAMTSAYAWLSYHPVGSNVAASSTAWAEAEQWHQTMDAYNNGLLCVQHRD